MGKVVVDITMSLDGFVTGPNDGPGNGLGDGGRGLHAWAREQRTEADERFLSGEAADAMGSGVLGRRTFDIAERAWGDAPPFGAGEVFVLTHRPHEPLRRGATTFVFVTGGLEAALRHAQASAGGKDVGVMGPSVSQQYLKAGLVDEMVIHVANLLLLRGRPLFAELGDRPIRLDRLEAVATSAATHLRYRVLR